MDFIRTYRHRFGIESICDTLTAHGIAIAPSTFYAHQARGFIPHRRRVGRCLHSTSSLPSLDGHRAGPGPTPEEDHRDSGCYAVAGIDAAPPFQTHRGSVTPTSSHAGGDYPGRPDRWWITDVTYVWTTRDGSCYSAFIVFHRPSSSAPAQGMILGWVTTSFMDTQMVLIGLGHVLFSRKRPSPAFTETPTESGIDASIGSVGVDFDRLWQDAKEVE